MRAAQVVTLSLPLALALALAAWAQPVRRDARPNVLDVATATSAAIGEAAENVVVQAVAATTVFVDVLFDAHLGEFGWAGAKISGASAMMGEKTVLTCFLEYIRGRLAQGCSKCRRREDCMAMGDMSSCRSAAEWQSSRAE